MAILKNQYFFQVHEVENPYGIKGHYLFSTGHRLSVPYNSLFRLFYLTGCRLK